MCKKNKKRKKNSHTSSLVAFLEVKINLFYVVELLLHLCPGFFSFHVVLVSQSTLHGRHGGFCSFSKKVTCRRETEWDVTGSRSTKQKWTPTPRPSCETKASPCHRSKSQALLLHWENGQTETGVRFLEVKILHSASGWTCSLWVCGEVVASLLVHLCLSGQQKVARLVLGPIELSSFVVVHHVQRTIVPVNRLGPVLLSVKAKG